MVVPCYFMAIYDRKTAHFQTDYPHDFQKAILLPDSNTPRLCYKRGGSTSGAPTKWWKCNGKCPHYWKPPHLFYASAYGAHEPWWVWGGVWPISTQLDNWGTFCHPEIRSGQRYLRGEPASFTQISPQKLCVSRLKMVKMSGRLVSWGRNYPTCPTIPTPQRSAELFPVSCLVCRNPPTKLA